MWYEWTAAGLCISVCNSSVQHAIFIKRKEEKLLLNPHKHSNHRITGYHCNSGFIYQELGVTWELVCDLLFGAAGYCAFVMRWGGKQHVLLSNASNSIMHKNTETDAITAFLHTDLPVITEPNGCEQLRPGHCWEAECCSCCESVAETRQRELHRRRWPDTTLSNLSALMKLTPSDWTANTQANADVFLLLYVRTKWINVLWHLEGLFFCLGTPQGPGFRLTEAGWGPSAKGNISTKHMFLPCQA